MPAAGLRLFGAPVAETGEAPLQFRAERRFQLLAFLAVRKDWVTRDELAHLFWPDQDNASARRNLRWVLHSAKELESSGLVGLEADRDRVRFATATDVASFERALAEGQWTDAAALYCGPFLDGLDVDASEPFHQWLHSMRGRYADGFRTASLDAAGRTTGADDDRRILIAQRLLAEDPFDEQALRILMRALAATGRSRQLQRTYKAFCERLLDEMGLEPSAQTRAVARELMEAPATAIDILAVSPAPITSSFVGRKVELSQIGALLDQPECRLLTIIGPGGIGKSRLAAEIAATRGARAFVALEALGLPSQIAPHVARCLGLQLPSDIDAEAQVAKHLGAEPCLVVLDNFEHLIDGVELLVRWLRDCPRLQWIVTSRERLEAADEWLFRLEGMAGSAEAPTATGGEESDAVRLFAERARRSNPDFDLDAELPFVREIVRLVDGMPLAIELAAAWTRLLPCEDLADDLAADIDVLAAPGRTHRAEHHSIRASFEHSWNLLVPRERELLARLSVFRGGFTRAASGHVAQAALPALASLVDKSLVRASPSGRFTLHPLLRQFAAEKLAERAMFETEAQTRHAEFFGTLLASSVGDGTADRSSALADIDADFDNCLAGWQWAVSHARFDLVESGSLPWAAYFEQRGRMREGLDIFSAAAEARGIDAAPSRTRAHIERGRATFLMRVGSLAEAQERARNALRSYRGARDAKGILHCVNLLGMTHWQRGEYDHAKTYFREGLKRSRVDGNVRSEWKFATNLALANQSAGNYAEARDLFELAAANARRRGDRSDLSLTLNNLGNLCIVQGDDDGARTTLLESLALAEETGNHLGMPFTLINLAILDIGSHEYARARDFVGRALDLVRTGADRQVEPMCLYTLARIDCACGEFALAHEHLGEAARIAVTTQNVPNMLEVAIWTADLKLCENAPDRAAEILSVVLEHPLAGTSERKLAGEKFEAVASRLSSSAVDRVRRAARELTLEGLMVQAMQPLRCLS